MAKQHPYQGSSQKYLVWMAGILVATSESVSPNTDVYLDKVKNHEGDKWPVFSHFPSWKESTSEDPFPKCDLKDTSSYSSLMLGTVMPS